MKFKVVGESFKKYAEKDAEEIICMDFVLI